MYLSLLEGVAVSAISELLQEANDRRPLSLRARAALIDNKISHATIGDYLRGKHASDPDEFTLQALSQAFGIPLRQLQEAAGVPVGGEEWVPPPEVTRLTRRQQAALTELIMAMAERPIERDETDDTTSEAEKKSAEPADPGNVHDITERLHGMSQRRFAADSGHEKMDDLED